MQIYNSIVVGGDQNCPNMTRAGNVLWDGTPDVRTGEKYLNPLLVDAAGGDYRVKSISSAVGAGTMSAGNYVAWSSTCFGGRLLFFQGAPLCGAVQSTGK